MLLVPFVVGGTRAGWHWGLFVLLGAWLAGYFAFNALSLYLRAKPAQKPRYGRPVVTYGLLTGVLGLGVLALRPSLAHWLGVYAPLLGLSLWQAARGQEASLGGRAGSVLAGCLMCAVAAFDTPALWWQARDTALGREIWQDTALLLAYFWGTVLYVKTMIRQRGQVGWVAASVGYHLLLTLWAAWNAWRGDWSASWPAFFAATTLRAYLLPALGPLRGQTITPKQVGISEFFFVLTLLLLLLD